jgi:hypothetical protein
MLITNRNPENEINIACDLTAIPVSDRKQHMLIVTQVFQAVQEVHKLPDGYAFRLPNEADMFMAMVQFVGNERRCCPFFGFGLEIEPNGGPLWLRLTGGEGVREFLETIVGDLPEAVRQQLIRTGPDDYLDKETTAQAFRVVADAFGKETSMLTSDPPLILG